MSTPPPATPFRVPLGQPPAGAGRAPAGGGTPRPGGLSRVLSTPRGQLGAAAAAVVAFALYRRLKTNKGTDPNAAAATTNAANPQGTADTTATDLYGSYEQLAEQLSGYNLGPQLAQIQASLNQALGQTSGTTSTSTGSTSSSSTTGVPAGWVTEFHRVGVVGQGVNIADYIKHLRPGISAKDLTAAQYATIINPANAKLGLGRSPIIPGGDPVTFVLPKLPSPPAGGLHDVATRGTIRNTL